MLPGHWLRGLSRSSENRCRRAGRKPLRRCGTEIGAGARSESYCGGTERKPVRARGAKAAAEVRAEICAGAWGQTCCGVGAEAGVC